MTQQPPPPLDLVDAALHQDDPVFQSIGLPTVVFLQCITAAERMYRATAGRRGTPKLTPFIARWSETVAKLRVDGARHGYTPFKHPWLELTASADKKHFIYATTGNRFTGVEGASADFNSTRRPRKELRKFLNQLGSGDLFAAHGRPRLWVFLSRPDNKVGEIRGQVAELLNFSKYGPVWGEMFRLPVTPLATKKERTHKQKKQPKTAAGESVVKRPKKTVSITKK